jgi:hypothetical protein
MSNYKQSPMRPSERVDAVVSMYKQGKTLQQIGTHFMVSRERIRQILAKAGVHASEGGVQKKANAKKQAKQAARDLLYIETLGMLYAEYRAMVKFCREQVLAGKSRHTTPLAAFIQHRNNSNKRGIPFNLKFADWWRVWQESGKWEQRAVNGYVMARLMDSGPYEIGNIYITTASKNVKHYQERRHSKSFDDWSDCYFPVEQAA